MLLTLLVRLPCFNHRARNGLATRSEHASLDIQVLSLSFRRDRLSKRDCMRCGAGRETRIHRLAREVCKVGDEPSGASSVKNGPRTVLSVAFPTGGLLSESMRADTPSTSERRMNSWRIGVHVWPVRVRNSIVLIHSSVVMLRAKVRTFQIRVQLAKSDLQDALGLGDKLMQLAYEVLEDKPQAPALARFSVQK